MLLRILGLLLEIAEIFLFSLPLSIFRVNTLWQDGPGKLSRYSDSLRAGRSGDRIPVWARFSSPVQTGPGAHPASFTMGTGSFPGVKLSGLGLDHPPPSSAEVKEGVKPYLNSFSGPSWPVLG